MALLHAAVERKPGSNARSPRRAKRGWMSTACGPSVPSSIGRASSPGLSEIFILRYLVTIFPHRRIVDVAGSRAAVEPIQQRLLDLLAGDLAPGGAIIQANDDPAPSLPVDKIAGEILHAGERAGLRMEPAGEAVVAEAVLERAVDAG